MRAAIIGGTGTLGRALTESLRKDYYNVSILSRCELKQAQMREEINDPGVNYTVGDIRDYDSVYRFLKNGMTFDVVYLVAALKHVDVLEKNPEEAIKTNVLGTINAANACEELKISSLVFSSTDKAVDPINAYGMSKGLAESILLSRNNKQAITRYSVFRWGNVIGSRGSVIPKFIQKLKSGELLTVTDPDMTRYWIKIEDAVKFMRKNHLNASTFEAEIPDMKAASVKDVILALADNLGVKNAKYRTIGNRGGEKKHEFLTSQHSDFPMSSETSEKYTHEELCKLLKPYCEALT